MRVHFLGVGEACDPRYPNTSLLVRSSIQGKDRHVLLDCGFTAAHQYFSATADPEQLDAVWISHFHGDHFFGLPLLFLRFWEMRRRKPFAVVGPAGVEEKVNSVMELAYPGFSDKLTYPLRCVALDPGEIFHEAGFRWQCAEGNHSRHALALRLDDGQRRLFYSGDGRSTAATRELAVGCDAAVHEAYGMRADIPGHGTVAQCMQFAQDTGVRQLALVHMQREERLEQYQAIRSMIRAQDGCRIFVPEPGDILEL